MPEPVIHIDHLSRSFGPVKALDDFSLEVPAGIVFGFLGPNGAGKTTTIRLLLGLLEPTQGQASVPGFDTRTQADAIRARSGTLLEALALSLLTSLLATSAGVLISLRAATVRQAQQTLALSAVVLLGVLLLATRAVPTQVLLTPATSTPQLWVVVIAVLVVLDAILLEVTFVSFQRSRLI